MSSIDDCRLMDIPTVQDPRGNLAVLEKDVLPFTIRRVYFLYDVPSTSFRGGHAHKEQMECLIATSGSFVVTVNDGKSEREILLNKPNKALILPQMVWRTLSDFSSGAVCLVVASAEFLEADYIRDYPAFIERSASSS